MEPLEYTPRRYGLKDYGIVEENLSTQLESEKPVACDLYTPASVARLEIKSYGIGLLSLCHANCTNGKSNIPTHAHDVAVSGTPELALMPGWSV